MFLVSSDLQVFSGAQGPALVNQSVSPASLTQPAQVRRPLWNFLQLVYVKQKEDKHKKYTLTGHFIRYTLLVLVWTPFCL